MNLDCEDKDTEFMLNVNNILESIGASSGLRNYNIKIKKQGIDLVRPYFFVLQILISEYYSEKELNYYLDQIFNALLDITIEDRAGLEKEIWQFLWNRSSRTTYNTDVIRFIFGFLAEIGDENTIRELEKLSEKDPFWVHEINNAIETINSNKSRNLSKNEILKRKRSIKEKPEASFHDLTEDLSVYLNFFVNQLKLDNSQIKPYLENLAVCCARGVFSHLKSIFRAQKAWSILYDNRINSVVTRLEERVGISETANEILDHPTLPNELKVEVSLSLFNYRFIEDDPASTENESSLLDPFIFLIKRGVNLPSLKMVKLIPFEQIDWKKLLNYFLYSEDKYSKESDILDAIRKLFEIAPNEYIKILFILLALNLFPVAQKSKITANLFKKLHQELPIISEYWEFFLLFCLEFLIVNIYKNEKKGENSEFFKIFEDLMDNERSNQLIPSEDEFLMHIDEFIVNEDLNLHNSINLLIYLLKNFISKFKNEVIYYGLIVLGNRLVEDELKDFLYYSYNTSAPSYSLFYRLNLGILDYIKDNKNSMDRPFLLKFLKRVIQSNNAIFRKKGYILIHEIFKDKNLLLSGLEDRAKSVRKKVQKLIEKLL